MKLRNTFLLIFAFATLLMVSCGDDEGGSESAPAATGITLDKTTLEIEEQTTGTLVATIQPEGAEGTVAWSSSDPSVAAVNNGVVTALKEGTTTIAASVGTFSATCDVTVTPEVLDPSQLPASLKGSNYFLIHMDGTSEAYIADKIAADFRPDDTNKFLYIWENTFTAGTSSGLNSYGFAEGWISMVVGNVGWSGAGWSLNATFGEIDMTDMFNNPDDYVFHIALKSAQEGTSYTLIFNDGTAEAKIVIGAEAMEDIEPYVDFSRDNEWHEIEIPMSKFRELGVFYNQVFSEVNILAVLAGGVAGTTLDMDAVFFYKKPVE